MARKPHNYAHFQNLVNELKEQNENNIAGLQTHLEVQTDVLLSMKGFMLKGIQADEADLRREKEERIEGKNKEKFGGLTKKSKFDLPRFSGKGFMGMLGNFLSTALVGIPGGLRRFLPRSLGLMLLPKLARGIALMVAGPSLIKALEAGFDQKTFSGGVTSFIDSYFSSGSKPYKSLAGAAGGSAAKGALIGFGLLGPRGAIIAGILSGALGGLNHIFAEDKSKMDSQFVMGVVKENLMKNIKLWAGGAGALLGMKLGAIAGPGGMIAGGILGAGIGIIGAGTLKEMMKVEEAGEKDVGKAFRTGLENYFLSDEFDKSSMPWAGGIFGAAAFSAFGPAGMLAGMILGAGAGILGGPVLAEALKAQKSEGGALADHMKEQLWIYLKSSPYLKHALIGAGLFGGAAMLGLGPVGLIAGIVIGGAIGIIATWVGKALEDLIGTTGAKSIMGKLFGKETSGLSKKYQHLRDEQDEREAKASTHTLGLLRADPYKGPYQESQKLIKAYKRIHKERGLSFKEFDAGTAVLAAKEVHTGLRGKIFGGDTDTTNTEEAQFLRLKFLREKVIQLERERDKKLSRSSEGTTVIANDSSMKMNTHISPDNAFPIFSSGLVDQIGYGVPT